MIGQVSSKTMSGEITDRVDITFFSPDMTPGGIRRVFTNLASELASRGYNIEFLLIEKKGSFLSKIPEKASITELRSSRMLTSIPMIINYLRKQEPRVFLSSVFHAHIASLISQKLAVGSSSKIGIRVPTIVSHNLERSNLQSKYKIIPMAITLLYPTADSIITISKEISDDLYKNFDVKDTTTIYNPVAIDEIVKDGKKEVEHNWFCSKQKPIILSAGRLTEAKRFSDLIRSFNKVRDKRDARLVILGEGGLRPDLENLISALDLDNNVSLPGYVDNPYPYMKQADVFASTSEREGFGNVIVEAMALGTPVMATDCPGGPSEILSDGKYGPIVPVGDHKRISEAIIQLLNNPTDAHQLQKRTEDFRISKITDQYESELLSNEST